MMRACIAGVTTGAGEYAPMPPVFGPWSPSKMPLVILRRGERQDVLAIRHHDEARFLALQEFLDDDLAAGIAELAAEHRLRGRDGFVGGVDDDHAFAGGEPARLDDERARAACARTQASKFSRVKVA